MLEALDIVVVVEVEIIGSFPYFPLVTPQHSPAPITKHDRIKRLSRRRTKVSVPIQYIETRMSITVAEVMNRKTRPLNVGWVQRLYISSHMQHLEWWKNKL